MCEINNHFSVDPTEIWNTSTRTNTFDYLSFLSLEDWDIWQNFEVSCGQRAKPLHYVCPRLTSVSSPSVRLCQSHRHVGAPWTGRSSGHWRYLLLSCRSLLNIQRNVLFFEFPFSDCLQKHPSDESCHKACRNHFFCVTYIFSSNVLFSFYHISVLCSLKIFCHSSPNLHLEHFRSVDLFIKVQF